MQTLKLSFSYQNIVAGQGLELAFAGMTIVFTALVLVSVSFSSLVNIRHLTILAKGSNPALSHLNHSGN